MKTHATHLWPFLCLFGCTDGVDGLDEDGDGHAVPEDCNDGNQWVYPGSHETEIPFDGKDQDCDGFDFCTDLNCDAWPDLVVTNIADSDGNAVTTSLVYYGSEAGQTSGLSETFNTKGATDSAIADLDGDGYPDLIFANSTDGEDASISSGIYWGSFSGYSAGNVTWLPTEGAADVHVEDIDADGYVDLIFSNHTDGDGSAERNYDIPSIVYWGSEAGFDQELGTQFATLGATQAATGDFDGDGHIDVAFAHGYLTTTSSVYLNSADGLGDERLQLVGTDQAKGVVAADLDDDGFTDLVFANFCSGRECDSPIYWGSPSGFDPDDVSELPTIAATAVAAADLDKNGHLDLVFVNSMNADFGPESESIIYWGSASGFHWGNRTEIPTLGGSGIAIGDLDEDSWLDIIVTSREGIPEDTANGIDAEPPSTRIFWGSADLFLSGAYEEIEASAASSISITPGHRSN